MTDYRISQDQWRAHDIKKLIGLLALLGAAAIAYFAKAPQTAAPDLSGTPTGEVPVFSVSAPSPWPAQFSAGDFIIRGLSDAPKVELLVDGAVHADTVPGASGHQFEFKLNASDYAGKVLALKEVWPNRSAEHALGTVAMAAAPPDEIPFTLESHTEGSAMSVGDTIFTGRAKPGTKVQMRIDRYVVGETIANQEGLWEVPRFVHDGGNRTMYARAVDSGEETPKVHVQVNEN